MKDVVCCSSCGNPIHSDQERITATQRKTSRSPMYFHNDHEGCAESARRKTDRMVGRKHDRIVLHPSSRNQREHS